MKVTPFMVVLEINGVTFWGFLWVSGPSNSQTQCTISHNGNIVECHVIVYSLIDGNIVECHVMVGSSQMISTASNISAISYYFSSNRWHLSLNVY